MSLSKYMDELKRREAELNRFIALLRNNEVQNIINRYNIDKTNEVVKMSEKQN